MPFSESFKIRRQPAFEPLWSFLSQYSLQIVFRIWIHNTTVYYGSEFLLCFENNTFQQIDAQEQKINSETRKN